MLKIISNPGNYFNDYKCGEVFYASSNSYNVACEICGLKVGFEAFTDHFRDHLNDSKKTAAENVAHAALEPQIKIETDCDFGKDDTFNKPWESSDDEPLVSLQDPLLKVEVESVKDAENDQSKPDGGDGVSVKKRKRSKKSEKNNRGVKSKKAVRKRIKKESRKSVKNEPIENVLVDSKDKHTKGGDGEMENEDSLPHEGDEEYTLSDEESEMETDGAALNSNFTCDVCSKPCHSVRGLVLHKSRVHQIRKITTPKEKKEYVCRICNEKFKMCHLLRTHEDVHTDVACEVCDKRFKHIKYLDRHKIRHTGVKAFKCPECEIAFYTKEEMKSHLHTHAGYKPYFCEECGKSFRILSILTRHKRHHTNERPFTCSFCGKGYYSQADVNLHMSSHSKDRPHACNICGKTYTRKYCLRIHKKTHNSHRPYKCTMCGKDFMAAHGIKSHMRVHGIDGFAGKNQELIAAAAVAAAEAVKTEEKPSTQSSQQEIDDPPGLDESHEGDTMEIESNI